MPFHQLHAVKTSRHKTRFCDLAGVDMAMLCEKRQRVQHEYKLTHVTLWLQAFHAHNTEVASHGKQAFLSM